MRFALAPIGTGFLGTDGKMHPMGGFGWSPDVFWKSTLCEFNAAYKGRLGEGFGVTTIEPDEARRIARQRGYKIFGE